MSRGVVTVTSRGVVMVTSRGVVIVMVTLRGVELINKIIRNGCVFMYIVQKYN